VLAGVTLPCPCGYRGDPRRECRCLSTQVQNYRSRISGPLLDRIDIHIEAPSVRYQDLSSVKRGESSAVIRARVAEARRIQQERFRGHRRVTCNAGMGAKEVQSHAPVSAQAHDLLKMAMTDMNFSARAHDRVIKVARTIADMAGAEVIGPEHITEAIQYRSLDRNLWV